MAETCLLCGAPGRPWFDAHGRHLLRCPPCGVAWVREGMAVTERGTSIYEDDDPVFFQDGNDAYYLDPSSMVNARSKLVIVERHCPDARTVLDVGAGFGHFVKAARDRYQAAGVELSPAAVAWAERNLDVSLTLGTGLELPSTLAGPYDVVTLWDVIEHVADPHAVIAQVAERLARGGTLILSTPDLGSLAARMMGRRWYYLDPVQHIILFSRPALIRLLERAGFALVAAGSMGHAYRLGYVLSRLRYFYGQAGLGRLALAGMEAVARPLAGRQIVLNPHDVMTIVARKR